MSELDDSIARIRHNIAELRAHQPERTGDTARVMADRLEAVLDDVVAKARAEGGAVS